MGINRRDNACDDGHGNGSDVEKRASNEESGATNMRTESTTFF